MFKQVAIDTSLLVGLINPSDVWSNKAYKLQQMMQENQVQIILFDCVFAEATSVIVRRLHEKKRYSDVDVLINKLSAQFPVDALTWIFPQVANFYPEILNLMRSSQGALNFNDALIALACQASNIPAIASFDADFDTIPWLKRLSLPEHLIVKPE
ncbi:MAG: type II toxin-antitoxin system VapC family toxin [Chloroflexi bacterium]|nr:type II toxin-antitoxin system VapC family toxin [Chloroflexota bacterium]